MPIRLERWMRSKLSAMTARTPSKAGALGRPIPARTRAVLLARHHHQGRTLPLVAHGRIVNAQNFPRRPMNAVAALPVRGHFIANADVGEGAAHHHFVVAAPGPVGVELGHIHAMLLQVLPGGAVRLNGASRGDVVGGHRVAQQGQQARAPHLHALVEVAAH